MVKATEIEYSCSLCDDCDLCPFPDCQCPDKDLVATPKAKAEAVRLCQAGYNLEQIVEEIGKSRRIIQRWLPELMTAH